MCQESSSQAEPSISSQLQVWNSALGACCLGWQGDDSHHFYPAAPGVKLGIAQYYQFLVTSEQAHSGSERPLKLNSFNMNVMMLTCSYHSQRFFDYSLGFQMATDNRFWSLEFVHLIWRQILCKHQILKYRDHSGLLVVPYISQLSCCYDKVTEKNNLVCLTVQVYSTSWWDRAARDWDKWSDCVHSQVTVRDEC